MVWTEKKVCSVPANPDLRQKKINQHQHSHPHPTGVPPSARGRSVEQARERSVGRSQPCSHLLCWTWRNTTVGASQGVLADASSAPPAPAHWREDGECRRAVSLCGSGSLVLRVCRCSTSPSCQSPALVCARVRQRASWCSGECVPWRWGDADGTKTSSQAGGDCGQRS